MATAWADGILPTDVLQNGYMVYACKATSPSDPAVAVRNINAAGTLHDDPANLGATEYSAQNPQIMTWSRSQFGGNEVMATAIDTRNGCIYVSTSGNYPNNGGLNTPPAQIYKISRDGATVSLYATLPGTRGMGWIDIDEENDRIYAANLDDGLMYIVDLTQAAGTQTASTSYQTFAPYAADPIDSLLPPLGSMILGVGFNKAESRLYYSIWAQDIAPGTDNSIRSIAVDGTGFVSGSDRHEFFTPDEVSLWANGVTVSNTSMPVSDIEFNDAGTIMLLAEQTLDSEFDGTPGTPAHAARVLEYHGGTTTWAAEPIDKHNVGLVFGNERNTRGGIDFAYHDITGGVVNGYEDYLVTTGDGLPYDRDNGYYVYGFQYHALTGGDFYSSIKIDGDSATTNVTKGFFGDVDVLVCEVPEHDLALTKTLASGQSAAVAPGSTVNYTITVYNQATTSPLEDTRNITVLDTFPASNWTLTAASSTAGWIDNGNGTASYTFTQAANGDLTADGGTSTFTVDISLTAPATLADGNFSNYAEVSGFESSFGIVGEDIDSNTLLGAGNDANEVDYASGVAPNDADGEHDDLDPATVSIVNLYDVALTKVINASLSNPTGPGGTYLPGDTVVFDIVVVNQSTAEVNSVEVTDYWPEGLTLNDPNWTATGSADGPGSATNNVAIPPIAPSGSSTIQIAMTVNGDASGTIDAYAEVTDFLGVGGITVTDVDSAPDLVAGNGDVPAGADTGEIDDEITGNDTATPGDDHDDLDLASVPTGNFDLALVKSLDPSVTQPVAPGADVTFQIQVINQGSLPVQNVSLTDYLPPGWTLAASEANWSTPTSVSGVLTTTLNTPIPALGANDNTPGGADETTVTITLTVPSGVTDGAYNNWAEVSGFEDSTGIAQTDSDSGALVGVTAGSPGGNNTSADTGETDDDVTGNDTANPNDDHDDLDPASVSVGNVWDVAFAKAVGSTSSPSGPNDTFAPGDSVVYTLAVTNQSTLPVTNVVITDSFPAGLTLTDSNWSGNGTAGPATTTSTFTNTVAAGATEFFTVSFVYNGDASGDIVNYAEVTEFSGDANGDGTATVQTDVDSGTIVGPGGDPGTENDYLAGETPGDPAFPDDHDDLDPATLSTVLYDVALSQVLTTPASGSVQPGDDVTFTLTVTNQSTAPVTDVVLTDYLPPGWNLAATETAWTQSGGTATLNTPIATLAANGGSTDVTITLTVPETSDSTYINWAEVTQFEDASGQIQPDFDSNTDTGVAANPGDPLNNQSNDPNEADDDITGNAAAGGDEDDLDPAQVTVQNVYDLALVKSVNMGASTASGPGGSFVSGDTVVFDLEVFNQGTDEVTDVQVTEYWPTGLSLSDANWSTSAANIGTNNNLISSIDPDDSATIQVTFTVGSGVTGNERNYAEITAFNDGNGDPATDVDSGTPVVAANGDDPIGADAGELDDDITGDDTQNSADDHDDLDFAELTVQQFDLALTKALGSSQTSPVAPGDDVTFDITVTNQGSLTVQDVEVADYLPPGWTLSATETGWNTPINVGGVLKSTISSRIPSIASGGNATVSITLTAPTSLPDGDFSNWAEVTRFEDTAGVAQTDVDSSIEVGLTAGVTGGNNTTNDVGETDDDVNGNDAATPGDDHDDLDLADITVANSFDAALVKALNPTLSTPSGPNGSFVSGDAVVFDLTLYNQSTAELTGFTLTDSIPLGLTLNDANWIASTGVGPDVATQSVTATVAAGASLTTTIQLTYNGDASGDITNYGEVTELLGDPDGDSTPQVVADADSDTDVGAGGDPGTENDYPKGAAPDDGAFPDDHDDLDPATISGSNFDVALIMDLTTPAGGTLAPGGTAVYTITVTNQSTESVSNIQLTDYLPPNWNLDPSETNWTQSGSTATLNAPITGLAPGASTQVLIALEVPVVSDGDYINWVEVTEFSDSLDVVQTDSDSDTDVGVTVNPGDPTNNQSNDPNELDGDISSTGGDEDDLDPAVVTVLNTYDVALIKTINATASAPSGPSSTFLVGDTVVFNIEVTNQSSNTVTDIQVVEYLPLGLTLTDPAWIATGTGVGPDSASYTGGIASIAPNSSAIIPVSFQIDSNFTGSASNYAEVISISDENNVVTTDADSDADLVANNSGDPIGVDAGEIDNDTSGDDASNPAEDHDDLDFASLSVEAFDLALIKTLSGGQSASVSPGDEVTYDITVINQGTLPVQNVMLSECLPPGWTLGASEVNWSTPVISGGVAKAALVAPIPALAANDSTPGGADEVTLTITLTVPTDTSDGSFTNWAEVVQFEDTSGNIQSDLDSNQDLGVIAGPSGGNNTSPDAGEIDDDVSGDDATDPAQDHDDLDGASVAVVNTYDLAMVKSLNSGSSSPSGPGGSFVPGDTVVYSLVVHNQSAGPISSFTIEDSFPAGFTLNHANWTATGSGIGPDTATRTFASSIAPGGSIQVSIILTYNGDASGALTNYAEVIDITADPDGDGTPNSVPDADSATVVGAGGDPGTENDYAAGDTPDDASFPADHDDLDPATINTAAYDVALTKVLTTPAGGTVAPGSDVTFSITVTNQSPEEVTNVAIADYLPPNWALAASESNWTTSGSVATLNTPLATLAAAGSPGDSDTVTITLTVPEVSDGTYTGWAEVISFADASGVTQTDADSPAVSGVSVDSGDPTNHVSNDPNEVDGDILGDSTNGEDKDDLDPASVTVVNRYDLAMIKSVNVPLSSPSGPSNTFVIGDMVVFNLQVINQGSIAVTDVLVTDYWPAGLTLNDSNWTSLTANSASNTVTIPTIAAGSAETLQISFVIDSALAADAANYAEVTSFEDENGDPATDIDSAPDLVADNANDPVGADDGEADNEILDDDTTDPTLDHDDLDLASISADTYDLALIKSLAPGQTNPIQPGDDVTFDITVINQSSQAVQNIDVADCLPPGWTIAASETQWSPTFLVSGVTKTLKASKIPSLAASDGVPGGADETTVQITLTSPINATGGTYNNYAFVFQFEDTAGNIQTDIDSSEVTGVIAGPNGGNNTSEDIGEVDDETNGNDTANPGEDHDDLDFAAVEIVTAYDVALIKSVNTGLSNPTGANDTYVVGDAVVFNIEVFNQANSPIENFTLSDYYPAGLTLNDANWSGNTTDGPATTTRQITTPLAGNTSTQITAAFVINNDATAALVNYAEITEIQADNDGTVGVVADVDSDTDVGPAGDPGTEVDYTGADTPDDTANPDDHDDLDPATIQTGTFDLALTKSVTGGPSFGPNEPVTFQLTITNQGGTDVQNITVTDYLPPNWTLSDPAWTASGATATRMVPGPVTAGGGTATVNITLTSPALINDGTYTNWAEITEIRDSSNTVQTDIDSSALVGVTPDPGDPDNNLSNDPNEINDDLTGDEPGEDHDDLDGATLTIGNVWDTALRKTVVSPTTALELTSPNNVVVYAIDIINQSSGSVTNVTVEDLIPSGFTFDPAANAAAGPAGESWTSSAGGASITLNGPLAANSVTTVNITLTADGTAAGELVNYAEVVSFEDPIGNPVTDVDSSAIVGAGGDPNQVDFGDGDDLNEDSSADPPVGASGPSADHDDLDPATIQAGTFDLSLEKTVDPGSALPVSNSQPVTYLLTITNEGNIDATGITVSDYVPAGLSYFDVDNPNWIGVDGDASQTISYSVPATDLPLIAGNQLQIPVVLRPNGTEVSGAEILNTAEISSAVNTFGATDIDSTPDSINDEIPGDPETDEDDHSQVPVTLGSFDLSLTTLLTDPSQREYARGEKVSFTIYVANQGTIDAEDVVVVDYIPAGYEFDPALNPDWTGAAIPTMGPLEVFTTIADLDAGTDTSVTIILCVDPNASYGIAITDNAAEIDDYTNDWGARPLDDDSTPDVAEGNNRNDPTIDRTGPTDHIDIDNEPGDEDDSDIATIDYIYFDLALSKYVEDSSVNLEAPGFEPGQPVTFLINVENQGDITASGIVLTDYIPTGLILDDADWTDNNDGTASLPLTGIVLNPGQTFVAPLTMRVDPSASDVVLTNFAEISAAVDDRTGDPADDVDSATDALATNDPGGVAGSPNDDYRGGTGTGTPGDPAQTSDEDDHDPAQITVLPSFDLALRKRLASGQATTVSPGENVTYRIEVINQGDTDADNISVVDYIPANMTLNDPNWSGDPAVYNTSIGPVPAGDTEEIFITLMVDASVTSNISLSNIAEITSATDTNDDLRLDADSRLDNDPANDGTPTDNEIAEDGIGGGDEDDHDFATLSVVTSAGKPDDFAEWETSGDGATGGPTANPDGDSYDNLLEYALCETAQTGVPRHPGYGFCVDPQANGQMCATIIRRVGGVTDVTYVIEGTDDLTSGTWTDVTSIAPGDTPDSTWTATDNNDGTETVKIADLNTLSGYGTDYGFVRLRVDLDTPATSSYSDVFGWQETMINEECETFSAPFLKKPEFAGVIDSASSSVIDVTTSAGGVDLTTVLTGSNYYIEIIDGPCEGNRFDLDGSALTANQLAVDQLSPRNTKAADATLAGAGFLLRQHQTLDDVVDKFAANGTSDPATADNLLFYDGNGFSETYWLIDSAGLLQWVQTNDSFLSDAGTRIVDPCEGIFVHNKGSSPTLLFNSGVVRENKFICPLTVGNQFVSHGFPVDQSPNGPGTGAGMNTANGFNGGTSPANTDQIQIWNGDTPGGTQSYTSYWLLDYPGMQHWTEVNNTALTNQDAALLLKRNRSVFIQSQSNHEWCVPAPWTP